jgi:hypothetical protein
MVRIIEEKGLNEIVETASADRVGPLIEATSAARADYYADILLRASVQVRVDKISDEKEIERLLAACLEVCRKV